MNSVMQQMLSHRSIRKFTDEPVNTELVQELVRCGQQAATSSHIQAVSVIDVRDPALRHNLAELAGGQRYVVEAGAFLVFCADLRRPRLACERVGGVYAAGMTEQFIIATVDVALMAQNVVVAAESMGLGICYIGALRNQPDVVSELLELPEFVAPMFGLCLGHPAQNPETKPRLPIDTVLMTDRYDDSAAAQEIANYDEQVRNYYRTRTSGQKDSSWSEEMARLVGKESRPHMKGFLESRGFMQR